MSRSFPHHTLAWLALVGGLAGCGPAETKNPATCAANERLEEATGECVPEDPCGTCAAEADPPAASAFSAAGLKVSSPRFVLYSITGQSTPVGAGVSESPSFHHLPGLRGIAP